MTERFSALKLIASFFFGEVSSVLPQSLTVLTNWCEDNISLLKTRLMLDSSFLTKFMMSIDDRIYQWLKQSNFNSKHGLGPIEFESCLLQHPDKSILPLHATEKYIASKER